MTVICNKFDARIKDLSNIQSLIHFDEKYIGKSGYFSDMLYEFQDLNNCHQDTLLSISYEDGDSDFVFETKGSYYRYFIPEDALKSEEPEKKFRPYKNVQELFEDIGVYIGDFIHFRSKAKETENHALITSYTTLKNGTEKICLGGAYYYTMQALFDLFELRSHGDWQPFGIEE